MCSWYGGSRLLDDAVVGAVEASDVKDQARPRRVGRGVTTVKTPNTTSGKSFEVWTSQWVGKSVCCLGSDVDLGCESQRNGLCSSVDT